MSEQYPLLSEFSDEERLSPRFHRRRHLGMRGRAKYQLKGAAAIMTRWPDHWTALLTYWWIGLGMIAITTFLIYNTLFSIALFQPTNTKPTKYTSYTTITHTHALAVYMHVFIDANGEGDVNKYIPHIEVFANKYNDFIFNLIVVANDTSTINLTDQRNNDVAMNSLWTNDVNYGNLVPSNSNIKVKYVTLSKYINGSPLQKHWKNLPHQFIPFLVRAVSIWEKGGIAINPLIFTPQSPHVAYMEKFVTMIKSFRKYKEKIVKEEVRRTPTVFKKSPKVNNILEIINALENENGVNSLSQETLNAAESRNSVTVNNMNKNISAQTNTHEKFAYPGLATNIEETTTGTETANHELNSGSPPYLLPLFLNYLFHNVNTNFTDTTRSPKRQRRSPTYKVTDKDNTDIKIRNFWKDIKGSDAYKPMIVSAQGIPNKPNNNTTASTPKQSNNEVSLFELTVDLKGNMIATKTPCHAFVGNMFTNAIHHDETENLTDFIIKELSIFCKGLLASCMGIDVILV